MVIALLKLIFNKLKSQLNLKKAIITLLFVIVGATVFAQTGRISGKVSDKKSGETLIGVTVKIKGSAQGMATDVDGKYSLAGLASGKYTLIFQYVGYNGKEVSDVEVTSGKNTNFDIIFSFDIVLSSSCSTRIFSLTHCSVVYVSSEVTKDSS